MLEVEERFKISPKEEKRIKNKILSLDAKTIFSDIIEDFIFVEEPFGGYYVRIRISKNEPELDIKIQHGNNFRETGANISNPGAVAEMLRMFGLKPHLWIKRYREVYEVIVNNKKLEITFDNLENVGKFVEISFLSISEKHRDYTFISQIKRKLNIKKKSEKAYGTIIRRKLEVNEVFKGIYERKMKERFKDILGI